MKYPTANGAVNPKANSIPAINVPMYPNKPKWATARLIKGFLKIK